MMLASLISYPQAIILGLLQGFAELFPISSLGHSVILPQLLGWDIHQNDPYFITFLVATHLATALVLLGFFWRDWVRIVKGLVRSLREREIREDDTDAKLAWLLVVGTIPAGILGLALEHKLRDVFASALSASIFLMLNGLMLYGAELLRRRAEELDTDDDARIARTVSFRQAFARRGRAGARADPGLLALGRDDGRRPARRALEQGRRPVRVPARDPDHRRRRAAQAAGAVRLAGRRRPRAGARRGALRGWRRRTCRSGS